MESSTKGRQAQTLMSVILKELARPSVVTLTPLTNNFAEQSPTLDRIHRQREESVQVERWAACVQCALGRSESIRAPSIYARHSLSMFAVADY